MGIQVSWDTERKTALRFDFDTTWSWNEYTAAIMEGREMMKSTPHPVHSLLNLPPGMSIPDGNAIANLQHIIKTMPPNMGMSIIIGGGTMVSALISIVSRVYRSEKFVPVKTLDEARALVEEYARTHTPLK